jgi:hypothetical protein
MSYVNLSDYNTAAVNTDVVVTLHGIDASTAPSANARHCIKEIAWSLTADPAAAISIKVESPSGTVIHSFDVTNGGPGFMLFGGDKGLAGALASNTIVTMDLAADSGAIGKLTVLYDYA